MACLRCGAKIEENQSFCPDCLRIMEEHPVKPDTPIFIPQRDAKVAPKRSAPRKKRVSHADRVVRLKSMNYKLIWISIILALGLALALALLFELTPQWINELLGNAKQQITG